MCVVALPPSLPFPSYFVDPHLFELLSTRVGLLAKGRRRSRHAALPVLVPAVLPPLRLLLGPLGLEEVAVGCARAREGLHQPVDQPHVRAHAIQKANVVRDNHRRLQASKRVGMWMGGWVGG